MNGLAAANIIAVGTALLAAWSYVRLPGLAPSGFRGVLVHFVASMLALQLIPISLAAANGSPYRLFLAVMLVGLPTLTYVFLAVIWLFSFVQQMARGMVR